MLLASNAARHSFTSYHLAMFEDAPKTSMQLGHRIPDVLYDHYRGLATKRNAEKYWDIQPGSINLSETSSIVSEGRG